MNPVVLVPWRPTPDREPLWSAVRSRLEQLDLPIITGDSPSPVFSLSQAFNAAADAAGPWDTAILSEADVLVTVEQIHAGLQSAADLTWCYDRHLRLTDTETVAFLTDGTLPQRDPVPASSQWGHNGVRVITRRLWDQLGGYDPAFVGWGAEDNDFAWRAADLGAHTDRIVGPMVELAHDRDHQYRRKASTNRQLLAEKHPGRYP